MRSCQLFGAEKFLSYKIKRVYCFVKVLKKLSCLDDVSVCMLKKQLMRPTVRELNILPFRRLSAPDMRGKFEGRVDFARWERKLAHGVNRAEARFKMALGPILGGR